MNRIIQSNKENFAMRDGKNSNRIVMIIGVIFILLFSTCDEATDEINTEYNITGTWDIYIEINNEPGEMQSKWIIIQDESNLDVIHPFQCQGTIEDNVIELDYQTYNITYSFVATVTDLQTFSGSWSASTSDVGSWRGEKYSESTQIPVFDVPIANTAIDGEMTDWTSVEIAIEDENEGRDDISIPGSDIEYVKLALNPDKSRLFFLMKASEIINIEVWYRMWFDNDKDGEIDNEPDDRQVDFEYNNGKWEIVSEGNMGDNPFEVNEDGEVFSTGQYIEGSVDIQMLGLEQEFFISGRTMQNQEPYNNYDNFTKFEIIRLW
jgi:hypothetical protein